SILSNDRVSVGTYAGDGTADKTVDTGLTSIKGVLIYSSPIDCEPISRIDGEQSYEGHNLSTGVGDDYFASTPFQGGVIHVSDDNTDRDPNKNGVVYFYIAWGT
ncbi:unnamed protein product, partial [marine sediment metagenome]